MTVKGLSIIFIIKKIACFKMVLGENFLFGGETYPGFPPKINPWLGNFTG